MSFIENIMLPIEMFIILSLVVNTLQIQVAANAVEPITYQSFLFNFSRTSSKDEEHCRQQGDGYSCNDCSTSIYCFMLPTGEWIHQSIDCYDGFSCNPETGICVDDNDNPSCQTFSDYKFICYDVGVFPHPYDCLTYYLCSLGDNDQANLQIAELKCRNGYGYDPLMTRCAKHLIDGNCPAITTRECQNFGDHHPISGNPYMYSVCLPTQINDKSVIIPQIFYCPAKQRFIETACQNATAEFAIFDPHQICEESNIYADPTDCSKYISCLDEGHPPENLQCESGQQFDRWLNRCTSFNCLFA